MTELVQLYALPFVACIVMGTMLSYLGIHVLKREVVFVDIAVAQVAVVGSIAAHLVFGVEENSPFSYAASLACVLVIAGFYALARKGITQISLEAVIGISYAITAAAAMFLIGIAPGHAHADPHEMLAGRLLWATWPDIIWNIIAFGAVGCCLYWFRKPLSVISEDYDRAVAQGLKVVWWDFLFYVLLGAVITLAVRVTGVVTVFAFLIIPATTSAIFSARLGVRMLTALVTITISTVLGLLLSKCFDFSVGPPVAMFLGVLLVVAAFFGKFAKLSRSA